MKHLWERKWFCGMVNWLNDRWPWWKEYVWGNSKNMEDFCRNPAEVLRDKVFPFAVKDIKAVVPFMCRIGFVPFKEDRIYLYRKALARFFNGEIPKTALGTYCAIQSRKFPRIIIPNTKIAALDITWFDKWGTKYPNAFLMLQIGICFKYFIPLPSITFVFKFWPTYNVEIGFGWGAEGRDPNNSWKFNRASMFFKFAIQGYSKELEWNPGLVVYGYWEGKT